VYRQLNQGGVSAGYGIETASVRSSPPRDIRIALVEPGSPAATAGMLRGAKIVTIDGVERRQRHGHGQRQRDQRRPVAAKAVSESHSFTFDMNGTQSTVLLAAQKITSTPVQNVKVISTATGNVGYLLFNDHISTSEPLLIAAVNKFKADDIKDLVLDMRYNGGGQLLIASRLAYMISSPDA
jgi:carboxyl-terminal processing protease